jgi:hypothetical protein
MNENCSYNMSVQVMLMRASEPIKVLQSKNLTLPIGKGNLAGIKVSI